MTAFATAKEEQVERVSAGVPLGRIGGPDDVAGAAIYLCSRAGPISPARSCRSTADCRSNTISACSRMRDMEEQPFDMEAWPTSCTSWCRAFQAFMRSKVQHRAIQPDLPGGGRQRPLCASGQAARHAAEIRPSGRPRIPGDEGAGCKQGVPVPKVYGLSTEAQRHWPDVFRHGTGRGAYLLGPGIAGGDQAGAHRDL
jgi:hypothetical protein